MPMKWKMSFGQELAMDAPVGGATLKTNPYLLYALVSYSKKIPRP